MNQPYFLKNLPTPLQFWIRPMLLISLALHGLLLVLPMPSEKKPIPAKKEPQKVKITQLPTTPPASNPSPRATPKPIPQIRQPQPTPIRQRQSDIPPIPPLTKSIPRPQSQASPTPSPSPSGATPSPLPSGATPAPSTVTSTSSQPTPAPSPSSTLQNPFADFPFPTNAQPGSLGLLPGENDKSARNTTDNLVQVDAFYNKELSARKFNPKPVTNEADLKVYEVSKDGGTPQYLHLISKDGKTVILLASQQVSNLNSLRDSAGQSPEELAFDGALAPIKASENFGAVDRPILDKLPNPTAFADTNKFRAVVATTMFKPMSPEQLFSEVQQQLIQAGFTQISPEASYGGGLTYKVTQGNFTSYLYFVANADNKTVLLVSKESPF
jgi:hypothetical protein